MTVLTLTDRPDDWLVIDLPEGRVRVRLKSTDAANRVTLALDAPREVPIERPERLSFAAQAEREGRS